MSESKKPEDEAKDNTGLGWSAGVPTGGSNAGEGVGQGQPGEEYGVYGRGATNGGRYADSGDTVEEAAEAGVDGGGSNAATRASTKGMADMDTSGLVESQVTRPSTITPSDRPEHAHNTERTETPNQRDTLSHKVNEEEEQGRA